MSFSMYPGMHSLPDRHGIVYGIRAVSEVEFPRMEVAITLPVTAHTRSVAETYFDVCIMCKSLYRRDCTCHDEGKGID